MEDQDSDSLKYLDEQPMLFEIRNLLENPDRVEVVLRTPDENTARVAFDVVRKIASRLKPRPKVAIDLYLGTICLDAFDQIAEGKEFAPYADKPIS